jgi:hypothetical protein
LGVQQKKLFLSVKTSPDKDHIFGLSCPDDDLTFYATAEERDEAAEDIIQDHLQEGEWSEDVGDVFAFTVTHKAAQVDVKHPEGELDEDRCDENGDHWPSNVDFLCNYALKPLAPDLPQAGSEISLALYVAGLEQPG